MRVTRSKANLKSISGLTKLSLREGKGVGKKRHTKSIEKELSICKTNPLEENKVKTTRNESSMRTLGLSNKRIALYQEYDDFLKKKKKDKRVEFIWNK